jgi:hypothetical protein
LDVFFSLFIYEKCSITECLKVIPKKSRDLLIAVIMNRIIEQRSKLGSVYIVNNYNRFFNCKWVVRGRK